MLPFVLVGDSAAAEVEVLAAVEAFAMLWRLVAPLMTCGTPMHKISKIVVVSACRDPTSRLIFAQPVVKAAEGTRCVSQVSTWTTLPLVDVAQYLVH